MKKTGGTLVWGRCLFTNTQFDTKTWVEFGAITSSKMTSQRKDSIYM